jgi:hypothetical protein
MEPGVLLAGGDEALRHEIEERAAARGIALEPVDSLDGAAIERAGCVILAEPGGPTASAFDVLGAGRVLLLPRFTGCFGLEEGLDHLQFADADGAITLVESYRRVPEAFARIGIWARAKARALRS